MGLFTRPRRSVLSTLDRARGNDRIVYSERELRAAVTDALTSGIDAPHRYGAAGFRVRWATFRIILGGPVRLTSSLVIPRDLFGLEIIGSRSTPVTCESDVSVLFDVRGEFTSLHGITARDLSSSTVVADTMFRVGGAFTHIDACRNDLATSLVDADATYSSAEATVISLRVTDSEGGGVVCTAACRDTVVAGCVVEDVTASSAHLKSGLVVRDTAVEGDLSIATLDGGKLAGLTVDGTASVGVYIGNGSTVSDCEFLDTLTLSGGTGGTRLIGCRVASTAIIQIAGTAATACIFEGALSVRSSNVAVTGCRCEGAVTINQAGILRCTFTGNTCNNQGITSSSSGGSHVIIGNAYAGTITPHANDVYDAATDSDPLNT